MKAGEGLLTAGAAVETLQGFGGTAKSEPVRKSKFSSCLFTRPLRSPYTLYYSFPDITCGSWSYSQSAERETSLRSVRQLAGESSQYFSSFFSSLRGRYESQRTSRARRHGRGLKQRTTRLQLLNCSCESDGLVH